MKCKNKMQSLACITGLFSLIFIFGFSFGFERADAAELEIPTINVNPDVYYTDEILYLEGRTKPNSAVEVRFQNQGSKPMSFIIQADPSGEWTFAQRANLASGNYEVRVRTRDGERASEWSNPRIFKALATGIVIGGVLVKFSLLSLIILLLLLTGAGIVYYFYLKLKKIKEESRQALREKEKEIIRSKIEENFMELKSELTKELEHIEKRLAEGELTEEEKEHRNHLLRELNEAERAIKKNLKNLE